MIMDRAEHFYRHFLAHLEYEPTPCQDSLLREVGSFLAGDDGDIMVVNGYAGTGKTTALSAVIEALAELKLSTVLLAPTGRAAKVLSLYSHRPAFTVHKHIYRQKSVGSDGFGQFSLAPNRARSTLFIVDEVSLIGSDPPQQNSQAVFGSGNLLEDLVSFVREGGDCRLILVGDAAQLPPVGLDCSPALSPQYMDIFGGVRYASLHSVVRQAAGSGILSNATLLRQLISSQESYGDYSRFRLDARGLEDVERIGGGELIEKITDAYSRYGEDETVILCRSNRRAIRYNLGIRAAVQFKEESLERGEKLMIVKNCYQFVDKIEGMDYIANGDIVKLCSIRNYTERYGLRFADARISFPDYGDQEASVKLCLDTLNSESAALTYEQQNALYQGVSADYSHISTKKKRYEAVREDPFYNALQIKYAEAITCHKSQGGQWKCVFIDNPLWTDELTSDDVKWLYTAFTRATEKIYLVNFPERIFMQ